ncbi:hypothetical protein AGMMS49992_06260 [Clostridia bacterium]|nr:hypothetical protein AGMMS49992_06260 [Clostridia bacterium]
MPRGRKKAVETPIIIEEPIVDETVEETSPKQRKPYPSHDERIVMADEQIRHWEELNAKRRALVATTDKTLQDRKDALAKGEAELQRVLEWKQRLIEIKDGVPSGVRTQSKQKYNELMNALKRSGKSMDELLEELGSSQEA